MNAQPNGYMTLSPEAREVVRAAVPSSLQFLAILNGKARHTGSPLFEGVGATEKAKRRRRGQLAKASRTANRS